MGLTNSWQPSIERTAAMSGVQRFARAITAILCFAVLLAALGCEKPPFDLARVRGTVTIDGQKLKQGKVMFSPIAKQGQINAGKPAYGRIQPDGSFVLYTYGSDDGAVVGEHGVTVIGTAEESADPSAPRFSRLSLPRRYQVVAGQNNQIDIEITKIEVAQYGR